MKTPVQILKEIDIFKKLSEDEIEIILSFMKELSLPAGKELFSEGDIGEELFIVISGKVNIIVHDTTGKEVVMAEITAGSFFGEMSIIENLPRSATCRATTDSSFYRFHVNYFTELMDKYPSVSEKILHSMLQITFNRLVNTDKVLSDMVKWEESARIRAITDDFTKLYNRHYLDETLPSRFRKAKKNNLPFTIVMIDLDHFGTINKLYGEETGDNLIKISSTVFKNKFRENDIPVRYGGDEFTILLPNTEAETAKEICIDIIKELNTNKIQGSLPGKPDKIGASMGIASFPAHARTEEELLKKTDQALYSAKEAGRNGVAVFGETPHIIKAPKSGKLTQPILRGKARIISISQKNKIINEILNLIVSQDNFLIFGHKKPDQDCLASMVSMALILKRFSKHCYLYIPETIDPIFDFVPYLCNYNAIPILNEPTRIPENISTLIVLDTPKPDMIMGKDDAASLFNNMSISKIEFDHHLGADSAYIGATPISYIDEASSTCELLAIFSLKIMAKPEICDFFHIDSLFTRSTSLALLTGMVGDTSNGRYLNSPKIQWSYSHISQYLESKLSQFKKESPEDEDFFESAQKNLIHNSQKEKECLNVFFKKRLKISERVGFILLEKEQMERISKKFNESTIVATARNSADILAEESRYVGVVAYYETGKGKNLIQFRARRNSHYKKIDLREILVKLKIKNGGGHSGAVGFRFSQNEVDDILKLVKRVIETIEELIDHSKFN